MSTRQLEEWFDELSRALRERSIFVTRGEDPVWFLVYPPGWSLEVYSLLPEWQAKLRHAGSAPRLYNVGTAVTGFIASHRARDLLVEHERTNPREPHEVARSVSEFLDRKDGSHEVAEWLAAEIEAAGTHANGLLIVIGVELLHPYLQIGRIEQRLQGRFTVPTIVCYPGERTGTFGLRYLGFYPPDGNYRSRHVGGTPA